jgi:hypothetical protein
VLQRLQHPRCIKSHQPVPFRLYQLLSIFDADVNAAKNILKLGISPAGGLPEVACQSSRTTGRKQEEDARKGGSPALQGREQSRSDPSASTRVAEWDKPLPF